MSIANIHQAAFPVAESSEYNGNRAVYAEIGMTILQHFSLEIFKSIAIEGEIQGEDEKAIANLSVDLAILLLDTIEQRARVHGKPINT